jgi:hypothetical protein
MASKHKADSTQAAGSPATTAEDGTEPVAFDFDYVMRMTQDEAENAPGQLIQALLTSPERTRQV